jgi:hypothetical protein
VIGPAFVDQHYLFHLLLAPFIAAFGMLAGTQLAAIFFGAAFYVILFFVLRRLGVTWPWLWLLLALVSPPLLLRLSLAKASPFAVSLFLLGLWVALEAMRKSGRGWLAAASIGFLLSLTHSSWTLLVGCQMLIVLGDALSHHVLSNLAWREAVKRPAWIVPLATLAGGLLGTLLHPDFPANVRFLWTLVVSIGLGTPFHRVTLGNEWLSLTPVEFIGSYGLLPVVGLVLLFGFLFARRRDWKTEEVRRILALLLPTALLAWLTLKSRRFGEYFVPTLLVWSALFFGLVDPRALVREFVEAVRKLVGRWTRFALALILVLLAARLTSDLTWLWREMRVSWHAFGEFAPAMQTIAREAEPGDRVFHSDWDLFPQLFALDDRLRYISGLDPTLLLLADPALSDLYQDIALGRVTSTAYESIRDRFGARFVLLEREGHEEFEKTLEGDTRFRLLYDDEKVKVYRVESPSSP